MPSSRQARGILQPCDSLDSGRDNTHRQRCVVVASALHQATGCRTHREDAKVLASNRFRILQESFRLAPAPFASKWGLTPFMLRRVIRLTRYQWTVFIAA